MLKWHVIIIGMPFSIILIDLMVRVIGSYKIKRVSSKFCSKDESLFEIHSWFRNQWSSIATKKQYSNVFRLLRFALQYRDIFHMHSLEGIELWVFTIPFIPFFDILYKMVLVISKYFYYSFIAFPKEKKCVKILRIMVMNGGIKVWHSFM